MQHRTYQLYAAVTGANAANAQIVARGVITGVLIQAALTSDADADTISTELSFQALSTLASNGATAVIAFAKAQILFLTSGSTQATQNLFINGLQIPVTPGVILYMNNALTGSGFAKILVYVLEP